MSFTVLQERLDEGQISSTTPSSRSSFNVSSLSAAWIPCPSRAYLPLKVRAVVDFLSEKRAHRDA